MENDQTTGEIAIWDPKAVAVDNVQVTRRGLIVDGRIEQPTYEKLLSLTGWVDETANWLTGDCMVKGPEHLGDELAYQMIGDRLENMPHRTKMTCQKVCGEWDISCRRRHISLSFSHFAEVTTGRLTRRKKVWFLEEAVKNNWSVSDLRKEIRDFLKQLDREKPLPPGTYRVLYADPPWSYNDGLVDGYGPAENHYQTLSLKEIKEYADIRGRKLSQLPHENAVLFLWATSPLLDDALELAEAWGFDYKTSFIWDKVLHNFGHYNSVRHELLLVCVKGSCTPDNRELEDSVITIERTEHSRKPAEFRELIDRMYTPDKFTPDRIELFARGTLPDWWDGWGNEAS